MDSRLIFQNLHRSLVKIEISTDNCPDIYAADHSEFGKLWYNHFYEKTDLEEVIKDVRFANLSLRLTVFE